MKRIFVNKRFQKLVLEKEANRIISEHKIKTIGVISSEDISKWIDISKEIKNIFDVDEVRVFSFKPASQKTAQKFQFFSEKSFGWQGQVKDTKLKEFLNEPFDLLIGYFNKNSLYTELAVLQSNARFKAGISKVNQQLYDLEIAEYPKNIGRFLEELKKYLQILQKL